MAAIPKKVKESFLSRLLKKAGLERVSQGKVRDTYSLPGFPDKLLVVATDRLSIFDFVLSCLVPQKGEILTALTVFWLTGPLKSFENHLVGYGVGIDAFLPESLRGNKNLQRRALVVRKLEIIPVECVVRGYLTGSGWKSYQETGKIFDYEFSSKIFDGFDGVRLPCPIFTPTTKSSDGHDMPLTIKEVREKYGSWSEQEALDIYSTALGFTVVKGIIVADTKFEFGPRCLADEVLTPDSSRFWDVEEWKKAAAEKKSPSGFDKEPVRQWGKTVNTPFGTTGINKLDPANPNHVSFVHSLKIPTMVVEDTTKRYVNIFERLTDCEVSFFQTIEMGIE